ncbi:MAG: energy-coupling factor transporter ATPase [Eubacteriales bacterium]|nr:energy-coupling factor transporter ATPase [Christensenellaceae bacterium]MDY2751707.1 energy-coupling factor transporter ATPase [Eubacteriales bacterium]
MAILAFKNLSFTYPNRTEKALDGIDFEIERGEFAVLCGESGCGKSTLLRLIKKQLQPKGIKSGKILYNGTEIGALNERVSVTDIGFVMQNPDNQIVTDKVWHELAFGLESLGEETDEIRRRVAEICGFFGIGDWYRRRTSELSGGQKQLLNLASIMVMQPKILVLDEPTSQLDPIAATDFIATLRKINEELGVTVLLVEHRLEEVFPIAHKVILMNRARVLMADTPRNVGKGLKLADPEHKMLLGLPSGVRLYNRLNVGGECPLTVREGRDFLERYFKNTYRGYDVKEEDYSNRERAIEITEGYFRYEKDSPDVLNGLSLTVYKDEILCVLGGNGAGKTTMLKIMSGLKRLYRGKLRIWGKKIKEYTGNSLYRNNIAFLPQNPQTLFVKNTLREDLSEVGKLMGYDRVKSEEKVNAVTRELGIEYLMQSHPFDLSGGEQQKAAFAKILLMEPKIILLDEPTKGIDAYSKKVLADILYRLKAQGITIVMVTHDIEFAAEHADRCGMFFDGQMVSIANPVDFFSTNSYYTTAASRISRGLYKNAVTVDMVTELCEKNGMRENVDE